MSNSNEGTGDIAADLAALRRDVARLGDTISELAHHQAQAAGHRVAEAVGDVKEKISGSAADAQKRVRAMSGEIEAYAGHHPLKSVLIALGIGLSVGVLSLLCAPRAGRTSTHRR
jgi:ElaB/YqjD/DUF883 family membrane-anchored ribosome-binding protein